MLLIKDFLQSIIQLNHLNLSDSGECRLHTEGWKSHTGEWLFYPGMLFGSCDKWWANWGQRYTPHEGVDITFHRNFVAPLHINSNNNSYSSTLLDFKRDDNSMYCPYSGAINYRRVRSFDLNVMVPAMADGIVLNVCDDFLGRSVVIEHPCFIKNIPLNCKIERSIIAVIYSHIDTDNSLRTGEVLSKGRVIGRVADTSMRKSGIPPHLHISIAEISAKISFQELNWDLFGNTENSYDKVNLFNPMWF